MWKFIFGDIQWNFEILKHINSNLHVIKLQLLTIKVTNMHSKDTFLFTFLTLFITLKWIQAFTQRFLVHY